MELEVQKMGGSAVSTLCTYRGSTVLCTLQGPTESQKTFDRDRGTLSVYFKSPALNREEEVLMSYHIRKILEQVVLLEMYPRSTITVNINTLGTRPESVLSSSINGASTLLLSSGIFSNGILLSQTLQPSEPSESSKLPRSGREGSVAYIYRNGEYREVYRVGDLEELNGPEGLEELLERVKYAVKRHSLTRNP